MIFVAECTEADNGIDGNQVGDEQSPNEVWTVTVDGSCR